MNRRQFTATAVGLMLPSVAHALDFDLLGPEPCGLTFDLLGPEPEPKRRTRTVRLSLADLMNLHDSLHNGGPTYPDWTWPGDLYSHLLNRHHVPESRLSRVVEVPVASRVTVITAPFTCPPCEALKAYLTERGVDYNVIVGQAGPYPRLLVDGKSVGTDRSSVDRALCLTRVRTDLASPSAKNWVVHSRSVVTSKPRRRGLFGWLRGSKTSRRSSSAVYSSVSH